MSAWRSIGYLGLSPLCPVAMRYRDMIETTVKRGSHVSVIKCVNAELEHLDECDECFDNYEWYKDTFSRENFMATWIPED